MYVGESLVRFSFLSEALAMRTAVATVGLILSQLLIGVEARGQKPLPLADGKAFPALTNLVFSPDSRWLATLQQIEPAADPALPAPPERHVSQITIWDVEARKPIRTLSGRECGGYAMSTRLLFSPDGSVLALAEKAGTVRFWNTATWESSELPIAESRLECSCMQLAFSADSRLVAVGCQDARNRNEDMLWIWDRDTQQERAVLPLGKRVVCMSLLSEERLAVLVNDSRIDKRRQSELQLWNLTTKTKQKSIVLHRGEDVVGCFSPDGARLVVSVHDKLVLCTTATGVMQPLGSFGNWNGFRSSNYRGGITALTFSTDGNVVACGGNSNQLHTRVAFWNLASQPVTWDQNAIDHGSGYSVTGVEFSPDGKYLATGVYRKDGVGDVLYLWDLQSKAD